jgi:hypothetical protein
MRVSYKTTVHAHTHSSTLCQALTHTLRQSTCQAVKQRHQLQSYGRLSPSSPSCRPAAAHQQQLISWNPHPTPPQHTHTGGRLHVLLPRMTPTPQPPPPHPHRWLPFLHHTSCPPGRKVLRRSTAHAGPCTPQQPGTLPAVITCRHQQHCRPTAGTGAATTLLLPCHLQTLAAGCSLAHT